jgi:hypothetical protein
MPLEKVGAKVKNALVGATEAEKPKAAAKKEIASKEPTFAAQEQALKPEAKAEKPKKAGPVAMPDSTAELLSNPAFKVAAAQAFSGQANIPANVAKMLLDGIAAEGVSDAKDLKTALAEYVDEATVYVQQLQAGSASYTWVKFHAGDTEVGYMFDGGALKYIVSDGWIQAR